MTADNDTYQQVRFEVKSPTTWVYAGSVSEVEPAGSLSSYEPAGRQVYLFGWLDGRPGVWRAHGGIDAENQTVREIVTSQFDQLSDLARPLEMTIWHRTAGPILGRFTLVRG